MRMIIVGAGLSGLVAADELVRAGHEVVVLEARDGPGGRVRTLREPFADGLYAEAGAARIPDTHRLTLAYAERFGLAVEPFQPGAGSLFVGDRHVDPGDEAAVAAAFRQNGGG